LFHYAVCWGKLKLAKTLVYKYGAKTNLLGKGGDFEGKTAMQLVTFYIETGNPSLKSDCQAVKGFLEELNFESRVKSWTVEDTYKYISSLPEFKKYGKNFKKEKITGSALITLNEKELNKLGVTKVGHVKDFLLLIDKLKTASEPPNAQKLSTSESTTVIPHATTSLNTNPPSPPLVSSSSKTFEPVVPSSIVSQSDPNPNGNSVPLQSLSNDNTRIWHADERIAIVITMSNYCNGMTALPTSKNDGDEFTKFLEGCKFTVKRIHDEDVAKIDMEFLSLDSSLGVAKQGQKKAAFIYYSGHGLLVDGVTVGISIFGNRFSLEQNIRKMSTRVNCLVIGFFDCCRDIPQELNKGNVEEKNKRPAFPYLCSWSRQSSYHTK